MEGFTLGNDKTDLTRRWEGTQPARRARSHAEPPVPAYRLHRRITGRPDDPVVPIQVFRTDTIKLSSVPHSGVPGRMMTSRNSSNIGGFQLQHLAAASNFCSASSPSLSVRPCSGHSLNFGTLMRRFHSSLLWSIRRSVRNAQFSFAAELPKRRAPQYPWLCGRDACLQ